MCVCVCVSSLVLLLNTLQTVTREFTFFLFVSFSFFFFFSSSSFSLLFFLVLSPRTTHDVQLLINLLSRLASIIILHLRMHLALRISLLLLPRRRRRELITTGSQTKANVKAQERGVIRKEEEEKEDRTSSWTVQRVLFLMCRASASHAPQTANVFVAAFTSSLSFHEL